MCNAAVRCGSKDVQSFTWMNQQYYNVHKFMTIFVKILSFFNRFLVYILFYFEYQVNVMGKEKTTTILLCYFHCLFL